MDNALNVDKSARQRLVAYLYDVHSVSVGCDEVRPPVDRFEPRESENVLVIVLGSCGGEVFQFLTSYGDGCRKFHASIVARVLLECKPRA